MDARRRLAGPPCKLSSLPDSESLHTSQKEFPSRAILLVATRTITRMGQCHPYNGSNAPTRSASISFGTACRQSALTGDRSSSAAQRINLRMDCTSGAEPCGLRQASCRVAP